ncbi:MAG TPA: hypothetical protein VGI70_03125, partial [Polyangiales bacterium]
MKSDAGFSTAGRVAAAGWLQARALQTIGGARWHVEIALDVVDQPASAEYDERTASRFHIEIFGEEWGFFFCHAGRASWIRVTDVAFVHGRDEFGLLGVTPDLSQIGA